MYAWKLRIIVWCLQRKLLQRENIALIYSTRHYKNGFTVKECIWHSFFRVKKNIYLTSAINSTLSQISNNIRDFKDKSGGIPFWWNVYIFSSSQITHKLATQINSNFLKNFMFFRKGVQIVYSWNFVISLIYSMWKRLSTCSIQLFPFLLALADGFDLLLSFPVSSSAIIDWYWVQANRLSLEVMNATSRHAS